MGLITIQIQCLATPPPPPKKKEKKKNLLECYSLELKWTCLGLDVINLDKIAHNIQIMGKSIQFVKIFTN